MFFKDVIGQEEVKRRLLRSVDNDHVAHAQLLCGPEGVGKFAMAMAYARYTLHESSEWGCLRCMSVLPATYGFDSPGFAFCIPDGQSG